MMRARVHGSVAPRVRGPIRIVLSATLALQLLSSGWACEACGTKHGSREPKASVRELMAHTARQTQRLQESCDAALKAVVHEATKYDRLTEPVRPVKDSFGDPMYTTYGPRAYVGSPCYAGPRYAASFERGTTQAVPAATDRAYYRGAGGRSGNSVSSDAGLGVGASHSYFQSGMWRNPGSATPTASRVMENNH